MAGFLGRAGPWQVCGELHDAAGDHAGGARGGGRGSDYVASQKYLFAVEDQGEVP
jgi:hypothetical protein